MLVKMHKQFFQCICYFITMSRSKLQFVDTFKTSDSEFSLDLPLKGSVFKQQELSFLYTIYKDEFCCFVPDHMLDQSGPLGHWITMFATKCYKFFVPDFCDTYFFCSFTAFLILKL